MRPRAGDHRQRNTGCSVAGGRPATPDPRIQVELTICELVLKRLHDPAQPPEVSPVAQVDVVLPDGAEQQQLQRRRRRPQRIRPAGVRRITGDAHCSCLVQERLDSPMGGVLIAGQDAAAAKVNQTVFALFRVEQLPEGIEPEALAIGQLDRALIAVGGQVENGPRLAPSAPFLGEIVLQLGGRGTVSSRVVPQTLSAQHLEQRLY